MADGEKPYRVYKGGRAKGKVPSATRPERKQEDKGPPRQDARPAALEAPDRAHRAAALRAPRRLDGRELPLLPVRCRRRERTAAESRRGRPCAAGGSARLEAVADAAARHRRRQDRCALRRAPLRLDPPRPDRPRPAPAGVPLDPARPARRDPGPRHVQDQRRLPARRAGADAEDGPRAHRPAAEPRRPGRLRRLPHRDRRARRRRDRRAEADPVQPVRLPVCDRRTLSAVAGLAIREGEAGDERPAGARSTHASGRTGSTRPRTTSRAASASRPWSRR